MSASVGISALLRSAGWLYGALWVAAAATPAGTPSRAAAAAVIVPFGPVAVTLTARGLLARRGRGLRVVPFAAWAAGATPALAATHGLAAAGPGPAWALTATGAAIASAAGCALFSTPARPPPGGAPAYSVKASPWTVRA